MKIGDQIQAIASALEQAAKQVSGTVSVAADPRHALELLRATRPGSVHIIVSWQRAEKRTEYEEMGAEDRQFSVLVARGGLPTDREMPALWELIELVRDTLRRVTLDAETTEQTLDYLGVEPVVLGGTEIAAAYELTVRIGTQLPAVETT